MFGQFTTSYTNTAQKMKFSNKDFFSKCYQICSFLLIWSHLLKKSLMESFIFCAVERFYKIFFSDNMQYHKRWEFQTYLIQPNSLSYIRVCNSLTLSWRRPLSYRNQSIDLLDKSMDWFLYDNGVRHERVKLEFSVC